MIHILNDKNQKTTQLFTLEQGDCFLLDGTLMRRVADPDCAPEDDDECLVQYMYSGMFGWMYRGTWVEPVDIEIHIK